MTPLYKSSWFNFYMRRAWFNIDAVTFSSRFNFYKPIVLSVYAHCRYRLNLTDIIKLQTLSTTKPYIADFPLPFQATAKDFLSLPSLFRPLPIPPSLNQGSGRHIYPGNCFNIADFFNCKWILAHFWSWWLLFSVITFLWSENEALNDNWLK